ncbi:UNKNOWN [Stylonychia lemnae]|uniref:TLDc domain-containing protein n=1 Tax=Stylonychia lemnae TaxID=5949 RepID=A0A077ZWW8_STYLE|nr:UNKNOWN [Stylonychia lemnae]|eukprot:CDW74411.1 UNKNOWN [Stylonychia lemnae]
MPKLIANSKINCSAVNVFKMPLIRTFFRMRRERNFKVEEIQDMISKSCHLLRMPTIDDQANHQSQNRDYILSFISDFSRLVDLQLQLRKIGQEHITIPQLFTISGTTQFLYKATRDGFKAADFHEKCDNQGPTISFILSEAGQVFGGYSSISWESPEHNQDLCDKNAFIFQLTKHSLHKQYRNFDGAVGHYKNYLQVFGIGESDFVIKENSDQFSDSYCNLGSTYTPVSSQKDYSREYLAGSHFFKTIEIEVYKVNI